jgi:hypothetical protein
LALYGKMCLEYYHLLKVESIMQPDDNPMRQLRRTTTTLLTGCVSYYQHNTGCKGSERSASPLSGPAILQARTLFSQD